MLQKNLSILSKIAEKQYVNIYELDLNTQSIAEYSISAMAFLESIHFDL